jgi:hypothetical protein
MVLSRKGVATRADNGCAGGAGGWWPDKAALKNQQSREVWERFKGKEKRPDTTPASMRTSTQNYPTRTPVESLHTVNRRLASNNNQSIPQGWIPACHQMWVQPDFEMRTAGL